MQRPGFDPWVGTIPWRRKWQPTPVCLPGESHGRGAWRATVHGVTKWDTTEWLALSLFFRNYGQCRNNFINNRTDTVPSFCEDVSQHEEHCVKCQLPCYRACSWVIAFRPSSYTKGRTQPRPVFVVWRWNTSCGVHRPLLKLASSGPPRPGPFRDCVNTFHWVCCLQRDSTQCS